MSGLRLGLDGGDRGALFRAQAFIAAHGPALEIDADSLSRAWLLVEEWLTNLLVHAALPERPVTAMIEVAADGPDLLLTLGDDGPPFDPFAAKPPDLDLPLDDRRLGGVGVVLLRRLPSSGRYLWEDGRNRLELRVPRRTASNGGL
jgi:anti-sigma regulatory factor (Ser/Thr protein kinase)